MIKRRCQTNLEEKEEGALKINAADQRREKGHSNEEKALEVSASRLRTRKKKKSFKRSARAQNLRHHFQMEGKKRLFKMECQERECQEKCILFALPLKKKKLH